MISKRRLAYIAPMLMAATPLFAADRPPAPLTTAEEQALKPKDTFKECDSCPEMVVVPAGSFTMGSDKGFDRPQLRVTIARPFAAGKFEVTFAEWDTCVVPGSCTHTPRDLGWGRGRRPVIDVSWNDITQEYLPWLSRKTGKSYRLLSNSEWEHAARAGTTTLYHFGNNETDLCTYDNVADRTAKQTYPLWPTWVNCVDGHTYPAPVGSYQPNGFGLHDMHGNVHEWVQDCWVGTYSGAPTDGSARISGDCSLRFVRGGSWYSSGRLAQSAFRFGGISPIVRGHGYGFRVGRTLD
jgi:formylglycine-generating enzyme required for sulfatase activity